MCINFMSPDFDCVYDYWCLNLFWSIIVFVELHAHLPFSIIVAIIIQLIIHLIRCKQFSYGNGIMNFQLTKHQTFSVDCHNMFSFWEKVWIV